MKHLNVPNIFPPKRVSISLNNFHKFDRRNILLLLRKGYSTKSRELRNRELSPNFVMIEWSFLACNKRNQIFLAVISVASDLFY